MANQEHNELEQSEMARKILRLSSQHYMSERATQETSRLFTKVTKTRVPVSSRSLRNAADISDGFMTMPICTMCKKVYPNSFPEICKNIRYDGSVCNSPKPTRVELFAYKPVSRALTDIISRIPNFNELCDLWRTRDSGCHYTDVYDGEKWTEQMAWLNEPGHTNLQLQFNIDWFNPFNRGVYSFGAIYMSILNLPRHLRYEEENILIIGCIPGPSEPAKGQLNEILSVMVQDLIRAQEFTIGEESFRVRLFNCVSDLPATRAAMGLMGHSAAQGCSLCDANLLVDKKQVGIDRSHRNHIRVAAEISAAHTKTEQENISKTTGYKDTAMLMLPYFQPVNDHAVDTMHNLCSGVAKRLFSLCDPNLQVLSVNLTSAQAPQPLIGRLVSGSSLTSKDFKTLYESYSHTLHGTVSLRKLNLVYQLKIIMKIAMSRCVSEAELERLDGLCETFLEAMSRVFGPAALTCNSHMMLHLSNGIRRFGPAPSNWCFPYERYNRTLKNIKVNNHQIAPQVMRQTDQLKQTAIPKPPSQFHTVPPAIRFQLRVEAPLLSSEGLPLHIERDITLTREEKRAIYTYMREKEIPAVFQIDGVKAMWVFGEEIRRGNAVWLKTEAILITQTVKVNDAFMVIVGHELHTLLREEAEGLIKTWQFKRICPRAFSPYLIQCQLTISSRKIQGVSQYSTEKRPSRYAY